MSKGQSVNALCKALASIATSYSSSKCHALTHLLTRGRRHALVNGCRYATGVNPTPAFAVITLEPPDSSNRGYRKSPWHRATSCRATSFCEMQPDKRSGDFSLHRVDLVQKGIDDISAVIRRAADHDSDGKGNHG